MAHTWIPAAAPGVPRVVTNGHAARPRTPGEPVTALEASAAEILRLTRAAASPHACENGSAMGRAILGAKRARCPCGHSSTGGTRGTARKVAAALLERRASGVRQAGARLEGREAIAAQAQAYMTAVPDCVLDVRGLEEREGTATLEWTYRGQPHGGHPRARGDVRSSSRASASTGWKAASSPRRRVYWDAATLYGLMD